jgi:alanyl-tRNA synthetase
VTERLYYTDPYATEFDAHVLRAEAHEGRPAVVLDRTAFYPTSGGQPFDTGRLGDAAVVDVVDRDDGTIVHVLEPGALEGRPAQPPGAGPIHGRIDWPRRFEHMQQHTGQHVLSAAFERLAAARTESFHLGPVSSTIDLGRVLSPADIHRVEDEANRIVWEDRPVTIRFADAEEAAQLPLRKESARTGRLRLIEVENFDISACGGTHVARTGAIGTIAVAGTERVRGGTRVEFLCGVRALGAYRALRDAVVSSVRLLSVLPGELPAGIERIQLDGKEARRRLKDVQSRLASFEAAALVEKAEAHGAIRVVVQALEGWDANGLKSIAAVVASRPGHVAVLFGLPPPSSLVIARAPDTALDCAALLQALTDRFGGKGGGRPDLAQGGGLQGRAEDLVAYARRLVSPPS